MYAITTRIQIKKTEYDIFSRIVKERLTTLKSDARIAGRRLVDHTSENFRRRPLATRRSGQDGGGERDRTDDPLLAKQVLSQLSYTPDRAWLTGGSGWIRTIDPRLIKTVL